MTDQDDTEKIFLGKVLKVIFTDVLPVLGGTIFIIAVFAWYFVKLMSQMPE